MNKIVIVTLFISTLACGAFSLQAVDDFKSQIVQADNQLKAAKTQLTDGKLRLQNTLGTGLANGIQQIDQTLQGVKGIKKQILDIAQSVTSIPDAGIGLRSIIFKIIQVGDIEQVINLLYVILDTMEKNLESIKANFVAAQNALNKPLGKDKVSIFKQFEGTEIKLNKAIGKLDDILAQISESEKELEK